MQKTTPKGIYVVAVVFFFAGLLFMNQLLIFMFELLGVSTAPSLETIKWPLAASVFALGLTLSGVFLLVRMHPVARWLMLGLTVCLAAMLLLTPAAASVLLSQPRLYLNRVLLLSPLIASCVYLFPARFPRSKRA